MVLGVGIYGGVLIFDFIMGVIVGIVFVVLLG